MNDLVRSAKQVREDLNVVEMALACRARDGRQDGLGPGPTSGPAPSAACLAADVGMSQLGLRRPVHSLQAGPLEKAGQVWLKRFKAFGEPPVLRIAVSVRQEKADVSLH